MKKRISAFLLALVWAMLLAGCVGDGAVGTLPPEQTASLPAAGPLDTETPGGQTDAPVPPTALPETPSPEPSASAPAAETPGPAPKSLAPAVEEDGSYHTKDEVALYIHLYGHLPGNYVTKREAQDLGWSGGSVERYAGEGSAIGGSRFGNYEGLLPEKEGRSYRECDIDTVGTSSRGAKRIVFSNDGLIYYTGDHYNSFELLYGEP